MRTWLKVTQLANDKDTPGPKQIFSYFLHISLHFSPTEILQNQREGVEQEIPLGSWFKEHTQYLD